MTASERRMYFTRARISSFIRPSSMILPVRMDGNSVRNEVAAMVSSSNSSLAE